MNNSLKKIFISYRSHEEDSLVAAEFFDELKKRGFEPFMAGKSIRLGENWAHKVDEALTSCDYFLVLISEGSALSEMVIEEVRQIKAIRDAKESEQGNAVFPVILPVRLNYPMSQPLNYDLRSYLQRIQQVEWVKPEDTLNIVNQIVELDESLCAGQPVQGGAEDNAQANSQDRAQETTQSCGDALVPTGSAMPTPAAEPELPGGDQVNITSSFYIERQPNEQRSFAEIEKPGSLIRIKAPRQMGKTSLMARVLHHATENGAKTVPISFQMAESQVFADLDKLLRWLCAVVSRRLRLSIKQLNEFWDPIFGSKDNCTAYFEDCILPEIDTSIVLALDGVDRVFAYPDIAEDFLSLLRFWHEEAKISDSWRNVSLIVVHSTESYIPMNINQSPFNVGLSIALNEFDEQQMQHLAQLHGLNLTPSQLQSIIALVGGHPYLSRVCMYNLRQNTMSLDTLVNDSANDQGPFADHLKKLLWELEHHTNLREAYQKVLASKYPVRLDSEAAFKLQSMGLVSLQGNDVLPRCDLYCRYFADRLG